MASQLAEMVPLGALCCFKCRSFDGVLAKYKEATVEWYFGGLNDKKEVIYSPTKIEGKWAQKEPAIRIQCIRCDYKLPLWILRQNQYIN